MKRKILCLALCALLAFALVSCEGGLTGIMAAMGKNILGNDDSLVTSAVSSVTVSDENKTTSTKETNKDVGDVTISEGQTISYKDNEGNVTELFTVGKTTDDKKVIAVGDFALTLDASVKADVDKIEAVLPPQDLTEVVNTLEGSGKDALLTNLAKPIEDENTKEAAKGTATLVQALLETSQSAVDGESDAEIKNTLSSVTEKLEKGKDDLTMGDVVVLQALTNILTTSGTEILKTVDKATSDSQSESTESEVKDVVNGVYDDAMKTVTIINNVSESTSVFKGMDLTTIVNKLMK